MPNKTADLNRQRLAAQALSGASGLRAFDDAQRDMTASRNQATSAALERARNPHTLITGAQQREIEGIVGGAYDPAMTSASQGGATMNRHAGAAGAAQAAYAASVGQHGSRASMMRSQEAANRQAQQAAAGESMRYGGYGTVGEYEAAARGGGQMLAQAHAADAARDVQSAVNERELARQAQSYEGRARREADRMDQRAAQDAARQRMVGSLIRRPDGSIGLGMPTTPQPPPVPQIPVRHGVPSTDGDDARAAAVAAQRQAEADFLYYAGPDGTSPSPEALATLTRQFATDYLLGDPLDALGRFPDMTSQESMQNFIDMAELSERFEEVLNYGPGGEQAAVRAAFEEITGGMDVSAVAASLDMTEGSVLAAASSDYFADALTAALPAEGESIDAAMSNAAAVVQSIPPEAGVIAALIVEIIEAQMPGFRSVYREMTQNTAYDAFGSARLRQFTGG